jgi:non-canonical purine NTP pyrophosphatase (RdgB/HAM1 family)
MIVRFATGNPKKLAEVRRILPNVEGLGLDLDEVQSLDPRVVIGHKLSEARRRAHGGAIAVEDVSFELVALNGFPGPLIRWLLEAVGADGIARIAAQLGDPRAVARAVVGLELPDGTRRWFEGSVKGTVTAPRGSRAFGWDPIFQPAGNTRTYGEMTAGEKDRTSHRARVWLTVAAFLRQVGPSVAPRRRAGAARAQR